MAQHANNLVDVTSLNFGALKESLKSYLRAQSNFSDYDYEASSMATLIDLLAYNTYQNAYYINMLGNEAYLSSAQLRSSVVARAKMLGYTPRSARGATATLDITITPSAPKPASITVGKDTTFTSVIDSITYKFVTPQAYVVQNDGGSFEATISVTEGEPLTHRWTVDTSAGTRYIIPNSFVDTESLYIQVQQSESNSTLTTFTKASDLTQVAGNSAVYFLQETADERYEVLFGDGIIGRALSDDNIVQVNYRVCHGSVPNGANNFTSPSTLGGYSTFTTTLNTRASGGANAESIESIKFSAPKHYETQNRGVTAEDYKRILLRDATDIQALNVWGGEENVPPQYGRVYIAAKPVLGVLLSAARKNELVRLLKKYNVMSIDPVFVDATYLFITPEVEARYDDTLTNKTGGGISAEIVTALQDFETEKLGTFSNNFYYVELIEALHKADPSIVSVLLDIELQKRFIPITTTATTYRLPFNNELDTEEFSSSEFTYLGTEGCKFDDAPLRNEDDDLVGAIGTIRIYKEGINGEKNILNANAGTIDYSKGLVVIENILIEDYEGSELKIWAEPDKGNVLGKRNQILLFADSNVVVYNHNSGLVESDTTLVTTAGTTATVNEDGVNSVII